MEASRVTVSDKTYDLGVMSGKKKTDIRRRLVVDYINSQMSGSIIKMDTFMSVIRGSTTANTHSFIKNMIRDRIITRTPAEGYKSKFSYTVTDFPLAKAKTKTAAQPSAAEKVRSDSHGGARPGSGRPKGSTAIPVFYKLEKLAKDYAWETSSDSLREFIAYAKGRL